MNVERVDVGTPSSGSQKMIWKAFDVHFHDFENLPLEKDVETNSKEFTCFGHKWCLRIFPGGEEDYEEVSIDLVNKSKSGKSIEIKSMLSIRVNDESLKQSFALNFGNQVFKPSVKDDFWGDVFIKRSDILEKCLDEGTLTVEVRMGISEGKLNLSSENPICKQILNKFMDEESADIVIEVGNTSQKGDSYGPKPSKRAKKTDVTYFYAHSFILKDGAPPLSEMCKQDGKIVTSVQITDVEPNIFCHMLHYVYGGKVSDEDLENNARALIDASDRYGVVSLKLEAERQYVESTELTTENIIDNLLYADSINCALLKEAVMDFIVENVNDIIGKVSFDNVPGSIVPDLLTAMKREKNDNKDQTVNFDDMRVGTLRNLLREKGLDVDGSREAMIALLKQNTE